MKINTWEEFDEALAELEAINVPQQPAKTTVKVTLEDGDHFTSTINDELREARTQNAELLAALEAGHSELRTRLIQHAQGSFSASYDEATAYVDGNHQKHLRRDNAPG